MVVMVLVLGMINGRGVMMVVVVIMMSAMMVGRIVGSWIGGVVDFPVIPEQRPHRTGPVRLAGMAPGTTRPSAEDDGNENEHRHHDQNHGSKNEHRYQNRSNGNRLHRLWTRSDPALNRIPAASSAEY
jgi:hypothetical protein